MKKTFLLPTIFFFGLAFFTSARQAQAGEVLGIHILSPNEISEVDTLLRTEKNKDDWVHVTIPFTLNDVDKKAEWQHFFHLCKEKKIVPIVRLTTRFADEAWQIPNKKEIVTLVETLSAFEWPTEQRLVIVFNEPNHSKEWGSTINPESYAQVLRFAADWMHTEKKNFVVLPAGLDLAAPNGRSTMEAFAYWQRVLKADPEVFEVVDAWNSHSYPNPAFSSPPQKQGKDSLRGFNHELAFLKKYTDKEFPVYITETGWEINRKTQNYIAQYYQYAAKNIWSHPQVKAVTPFILKGSPGPFAEFSFIDESGQATRQFQAYRSIIESDILTP